MFWQPILPPFSPKFCFGVATADHQCEAYNGQDDIRDVWEGVRGLKARGRATDFWNRFPEDVLLAKNMGCTAFRVSLSWSRLEPTAGTWDAAAFEHYRELLSCIRSAGLKTIVTLHHNTWPVHIQAAGGGAGMLDSAFPDRFADYAREVAARLGKLIDYYITINEPNQLIYGFIKGWWMRAYPMPPGLFPFANEQEQMSQVLELIPNLFRAHARARTAIRTESPDAPVGSNPLVLGLPRWLRWWVDRHATRATRPRLFAQAKRLTQTQLLTSGKVDFSIAQLTLTQQRMDKVLFSEPYFIAKLSALHSAGFQIPDSYIGWTGRIAVTAPTAPAQQAPFLFPAATIQAYSNSDDAVAALRNHEADVVLDDDVMLRKYLDAGLALSPLVANDQPFAIAMRLGSRTLLNAVDLALRAFKQRDSGGTSLWDIAVRAEFAEFAAALALPNIENRKTVAKVGRSSPPLPAPADVPTMDSSLDAIKKRGVLRVGIHPGVPGLCMPDASGGYVGLELTIARYIASQLLRTPNPRLEFVPLDGEKRLDAARSPLGFLDPIKKMISMLSSIAGANWWNLGMAGELPSFLCPECCVGTTDFIGLDYYWGVRSLWPGRLQHLAAAMECRYANAPVWPRALYDLLVSEHARFPDQEILVIENGCVDAADGILRQDYIKLHVAEVQRAVQKGVPVGMYLSWSITSNREWGLLFDNNSNFGLYYIDLDHDPLLTRTATPAVATYSQIIARRSAT